MKMKQRDIERIAKRNDYDSVISLSQFRREDSNYSEEDVNNTLPDDARV